MSCLRHPRFAVAVTDLYGIIGELFVVSLWRGAVRSRIARADWAMPARMHWRQIISGTHLIGLVAYTSFISASASVMILKRRRHRRRCRFTDVAADWLSGALYLSLIHI